MTMTSMERFFEMVNEHPRFARYWDRETENLDVDGLVGQFGVWSHGEVEFAKFLSSVWFGSSARTDFDFIYAMKIIDAPYLPVVKAWVRDPFFP